MWRECPTVPLVNKFSLKLAWYWWHSSARIWGEPPRPECSSQSPPAGCRCWSCSVRRPGETVTSLIVIAGTTLAPTSPLIYQRPKYHREMRFIYYNIPLHFTTVTTGQLTVIVLCFVCLINQKQYSLEIQHLPRLYFVQTRCRCITCFNKYIIYLSLSLSRIKNIKAGSNY